MALIYMTTNIRHHPETCLLKCNRLILSAKEDTINVEIFAQFIFFAHFAQALRCAKIDVRENYYHTRTNSAKIKTRQ